MDENLILWDIDGTLTTTKSGSLDADEKALNHALFEIFNLNSDQIWGNYVNKDPDFAFLHGKTDVEVIRSVLEGLVSEKQINDKLDETIYSMGLAYNNYAHIDETIAIEDAKQVLNELQNVNRSMGLITGNLEAIARKKIRLAGLDSSFELYGCPKKNIYMREDILCQTIENAKNLYSTNFVNTKIIVVGDTPNDVLVASKNGVKSLAVATGKFSIKELQNCNPTYAVNTLTEGLKYLL